MKTHYTSQISAEARQFQRGHSAEAKSNRGHLLRVDLRLGRERRKAGEDAGEEFLGAKFLEGGSPFCVSGWSGSSLAEHVASQSYVTQLRQPGSPLSFMISETHIFMKHKNAGPDTA